MVETKTTFDYVGEIWSIADWVRDVIRPADYNKLILPFALLRRLECALEPTRDAVCKVRVLRPISGEKSSFERQVRRGPRERPPSFIPMPARVRSRTPCRAL